MRLDKVTYYEFISFDVAEKKRKNATKKGKCPAMNGAVIRGSGVARQDKFVCQGLGEGKKELNAKLLEGPLLGLIRTSK